MLLIFLSILILTQQLPTTQQLLSLQPGQIQYIIIISKYSPLPSQTKQYLQTRYKDTPNATQFTSRDYDSHIIHETFKRFYNWNKTLQIVIDQNNKYLKAEILKQIQTRFNDQNYSATLLYYSGPADPLYGGWIVSDDEKWNKIITYKDISRLWKSRTQRKSLQHLHIVLESDYSQHWVQKCYTMIEFDDISIQAAALKNETVQNIKYGGLFTHNFGEVVLNFRNQTFIKENTDKQHTNGVGFEIFLQKILGVSVYFQSWDELFENRMLPIM